MKKALALTGQFGVALPAAMPTSAVELVVLPTVHV